MNKNIVYLQIFPERNESKASQMHSDVQTVFHDFCWVKVSVEYDTLRKAVGI